MSTNVTFLGHAAFTFEADGQTILVDPFLTGNAVASTDANSVNPNTILLSHAHNDHVGDTVAIAKRTNATVITTVELANWLGTQGLNNVVGANHGGTVTFEGGSVKFTPAWHSSAYTTDDGSIVAIGIPAGMVVRLGGQAVYFAGDTSLFGDMALIAEEELDAAILPIGDHFTMGPADAVKAVKMLRAGTIIPCHYNTFPPIRQDAQAFKQQVETETASTVAVLEPGESVTI